MENQTPYWDDKFRTHVEDVTRGEFPQVERTLLPHLCMQCDHSPCVEACPTGATYQTPEGIVVVDRDRCIDCRYCIAACPYGARYEYTDADRVKAQAIFGNAPTKTFVDKCTFCEHRLKAGQEPACVATCLAGARIFGDLDDPQSKVAQLVASGKAKPIAPEVGTRPKVYYLADDVKAMSLLPVNVASHGLVHVRENGRMVGSLGLGLVALGALGVFGFARRNASEHFAHVAAEMEAPAAETPEKE
jgi:Fe-S-cluster-containing dehydrogenase component